MLNTLDLLLGLLAVPFALSPLWPVRLRDRGWPRRMAYWAFSAFAVRYVVWRLATLPAPSVASLLAYALVPLEWALVMAAWRTMQVSARTLDRSTEADLHAGWWGDSPPLIAILIPTFNEPEDMLTRTLAAATHLDYPNYRVYLLDDGARDSVRLVARQANVEYLQRAERLGGKAGNLNHAIASMRTDNVAPDFIAVFDADYVPQPAFIRRTLALMHDEHVALVQTPQAFYNRDNFQNAFSASLRIPDRLRFTYDDLLPSRDAAGAAHCCGTSFLLRTHALAQIGDRFPTESVTEDLLTTFLLRQKGWKIAYLRERMSFGLATARLQDFLVQRRRWGLGFAQMARIQWRTNPAQRSVWKRALSFEAYMRINYTAIVRAAFLLVPAIAFWSGAQPFFTPAAQVLSHTLPVILTSRGSLGWLSRWRNLPFLVDAVGVLGALSAAAAWFQAWTKMNHAFVVTDKAERSASTAPNLPLTIGLLAAIAATLTGLMHASYGTIPLRPDLLIWSVLSLVVFAVALACCVELPQRRAEERFDARAESARIEHSTGDFEAHIHDVSTRGAALDVPGGSMAPGRSFSLWITDVGPVPAVALRLDGPSRCACSLHPDAATKRALVRKLYTPNYIRPVDVGRMQDLFTGLFRRLVGKR